MCIYIYIYTYTYMWLLWQGAECNMGNIFQLSHILLPKFEKRGKYLPILLEATCDNYFIVKCLLKLNVARIILLTTCIEPA